MRNKLQIKINKIAKLIDAKKPCLTCNSYQIQAGHRISVGSNPTLRYNLHNIHVECEACNNNHNNKKYDIGIIKRYGYNYLEYIDSLKIEYKELHLTSYDLRQAIKKANKIIRELESGKVYTRSEINLKIGIYD